MILFGVSTLFALVTLPVEFNASSRAKDLLVNQGIIQGDEQVTGVSKVLGAAAGAVSAVGTLLYYVLLLSSSTSRRR